MWLLKFHSLILVLTTTKFKFAQSLSDTTRDFISKINQNFPNHRIDIYGAFVTNPHTQEWSILKKSKNIMRLSLNDAYYFVWKI